MAAEKLDIEEVILRGVGSDRYVLSKSVDEGFSPELFHASVARLIASTLIALWNEGANPADSLLLKARLQEQGMMTAEVSEYLGQMARIPAQPMSQILTYLELLKHRWAREQLIALASRVDGYARQNQAAQPFEEFVGEALRDLLEIQKQRLRRRLAPVKSTVQELVSEAIGRPPGTKILLGYSLAPFGLLEKALSGLRPGFYYGLAGAPRRGKTSLALQLARTVAKNHRIPVLFYSWEQTQRVLSARLVGQETGLNPANLLTTDTVSRPGTTQRLAKGLGEMQRFEQYLYILEGTRQDTADRIRAAAYNLMHESRTDSVAIFLDYLQKVPLRNPPPDVRARIDEISTGLAELSLELHCPIVAISSLDREGCRLDEEPAEDDWEGGTLNRLRPTMHHCTGSGDIEYDLDVAMILSKDWKATKELEELLKSKSSEAAAIPKIDVLDLYIDKNRDASEEAVQAIQYAFFVHQNLFVELAYKSEEEYKAEFRGYAQIQRIFAFLQEEGHLLAVQPS